jgi:two-component system, OmpR family, sensor kinase
VALRPLARAKQVRLEVEHPAVLEITGDEGRLKELLENLVDNAVKYTSAGGWVRVTVDLKGDDVRVTVADSGIGIPGEAVRHVFERFYRVDAARSREEGGTGLGLAIVEWIVQAHGGRVVVDSRPGEGTLVTVRLPRTHGAEA